MGTDTREQSDGSSAGVTQAAGELALADTQIVGTPSTPLGAADRSSKALRDMADAETERGELRRGVLVAVWLWPTFTLLDVYMALFLYPATPVWHFLAMRGVEQAVLLFLYRISGRPGFSVKWLRVEVLSAVQLCAVFIALMALDFGGLNSVYMHGLSVIILAVAITLPARWQSATRTLAPIALMHPIVMGIAAVFSPDMRGQWADRQALLTFASQYTFVLSMVGAGAMSSQLVWAARQQVYQARKLGRYRLEVPIGEGGMNQVWLAWDVPLRRHVALKILRPGTAPRLRAVERFEREARAASTLADPHTIRMFDYGASDDGIYYIAMEYLRGADLAALVSDHGPMPLARVIHFAAQACASLSEAHDVGIVHRDVKPQNFFVTHVGDDHDFLKLLDFGIAQVLEVENADHLTQTGTLAGTPAFMAPEVCRGGRADARSDLYALGATMYFLLAGSPPFDGPSPGQVLAAHMVQAPERPSVRRGEPIPEALEQVVLRCLAKDPRDRFQTARDLGAALAQLADVNAWTAEDARRFWQGERAAKLGRREAPTMEAMPVTRAEIDRPAGAAGA
jgi:serine/threonine-protein kinase